MLVYRTGYKPMYLMVNVVVAKYTLCDIAYIFSSGYDCTSN